MDLPNAAVVASSVSSSYATNPRQETDSPLIARRDSAHKANVAWS